MPLKLSISGKCRIETLAGVQTSSFFHDPQPLAAGSDRTVYEIAELGKSVGGDAAGGECRRVNGCEVLP